MVIERALEKLRQAEAAKAGTSRKPAPAAAGQRPVQRNESPPAERPVIPCVSASSAAGEAHRILVPYARIAGDARADAAYRMVRTRLLHKMRQNNWTTLAITSPGPGEGKSFTALNLALNIAREKSADVFLLDLDMRNPSICRFLGVHPPRDLVGYFAGEGAPADILFSIGVDRLTIAGSITPTDRASELIASGKLEELIGYIKSIAADPIILIDLPPILVTDEALLVAPRVDATALIVAEGRTRRDGLVRASQLLAEYTFAGVILNCSSERFGGDYYHYRYGDPQS